MVSGLGHLIEKPFAAKGSSSAIIILPRSLMFDCLGHGLNGFLNYYALAKFKLGFNAPFNSQGYTKNRFPALLRDGGELMNE